METIQKARRHGDSELYERIASSDPDEMKSNDILLV
jgi:hypothetical protein